MYSADLLADTSTTYLVRFSNLDLMVEVADGETILQAARRSKIRIVASCGGQGVCGSCRVKILSGQIDNLAEETDAQEQKWVRACLIRPLSDCIIEVSPQALADVARTDVETADLSAVLPMLPAVQGYELRLTPSDLPGLPALQAPLIDASGVDEVNCPDRAVLDGLAQVLPENDWQIRAYMRQGELIGCNPAGTRTLGMAVDLGTTNTAAFLIDLENGDRLASCGIENPQVAYGADLVSRLNHALTSESASRELQATIVAGLKELSKNLCESAAVSLEEISDIVICGNTGMHHLLLGLPVASLARAPFVASSSAATDIKARDLDFTFLPGAYVHLLPNVGGFVGGDHVAALLATEPLWAEATTIVMDIGTNTEISLVRNGAIRTVSCPSGPALEGGNISCGMRAAKGAIERVTYVDGRIECQVIGGGTAIGLCGSGVLDAIASMQKAGIIDARGRIKLGHPGVAEVNGRRQFRLAETVVLTQDDVRAVQLAKAAIRSGIDMLLCDAGMDEQSIERFVIAGAFGLYVDILNAVEIGLFPELPEECFEQVGNAAGVGAQMTLASIDVRKQATELVARCQHIELNNQQDFQKAFLNRIPLK
jgi:uncharacterized 2Fe-2S/4Fe-4S cluster protein (DUF4445 family)